MALGAIIILTTDIHKKKALGIGGSGTLFLRAMVKNQTK